MGRCRWVNDRDRVNNVRLRVAHFRSDQKRHIHEFTRKTYHLLAHPKTARSHEHPLRLRPVQRIIGDEDQTIKKVDNVDVHARLPC